MANPYTDYRAGDATAQPRADGLTRRTADCNCDGADLDGNPDDDTSPNDDGPPGVYRNSDRAADRVAQRATHRHRCPAAASVITPGAPQPGQPPKPDREDMPYLAVARCEAAEEGKPTWRVRVERTLEEIARLSRDVRGGGWPHPP